MGKVKAICEKYDIKNEAGFSSAMKEMKGVSEGELRFLLSYDLNGQSNKFRDQYVLAKSEIERREFEANRKLTVLQWIIGFLGLLAGAALQAIL